MTSPETLALYEELRGTECRCGQSKRSRQTFCGSCYHALPRVMRRDLYKRLGLGYAEAFEAAVEWLTERGHIDRPAEASA